MPGRSNQPLLIIEDSDEDFAAVGRMMSRSSLRCPVYRCTDGDDALDFLYRQGDYQDSAQAPRPAVIMLDLNLPGTDGREVLQQIKQDEVLKIIPVVVFTTSANPKDIQACYQHGASGYIIKPINLQGLKRAIQIFIDYWFETVVLPEE